MELPSIITVHGLYQYFIGLLLAITLAFALYIVLGYFGLVPGPEELVSGLLFDVPGAHELTTSHGTGFRTNRSFAPTGSSD